MGKQNISQRWLHQLGLDRWLKVETMAQVKTEPPSEAKRFDGIDALTGLGTTRSMIAFLENAKANGTHGSAAFIDLDRFKHLNMDIGFECGDAVLTITAQRLRDSLPQSATAFRVGGDEFMVPLPGTGLEAAEQLMSMFCDQMRRPIGFDDAPLFAITASVGITAIGRRSTDDLRRECDLALFTAKRNGRDRIVVFTDDIQLLPSDRRDFSQTLIDLQVTNGILRDRALTDALTGLGNRLALDQIMGIETGSDTSPWGATSVAFIDIDHFSDFNHLHGDANGDDALKAVATAIKETARADDLVFRKGGEEFVVVLTGAEGEKASNAAERIRAGVEALAIPHSGSRVAAVVTVTVGLASGTSQHSVRQLMEAAADETMAAKVKNQRNRVHSVLLRAARPNATE